MRIIALIIAMALCACAPSLSQVQQSLAGYHIAVETTGAGVAVVNSRTIALSGEAGARLMVTAPVMPDGTRMAVLERELPAAGVMAWRVLVRQRDGEQWLRLERVSCAYARAELPELPDCPASASVHAPDVIERRVYLFAR